MFGVYDVQILSGQLGNITWVEIRSMNGIVGLDSVFIPLTNTPMLVLNPKIGKCLCLRTNAGE